MLKFIDFVLGVSDPSIEDRLIRLALGIVLPGLLLLYGVSCVLSGQATFLGRGGIAHLSGSTAVAVGVAYTATGLLGYVHTCWKGHPHLAGLRDPVRSLLLALIAAALISTFFFVLI